MDAPLTEAFVAWLEGIRWDYFVTHTFRHPASHAHVVSAIREWMASAGPQAYAAVAYERGPWGGRLHCHAVIGGVGRHPLRLRHLEGSWRRGIISIAPYQPHRGGVRYLCAFADDPDGLEFIGTLQRFRPRKRGTRGGQRNGTHDTSTARDD